MAQRPILRGQYHYAHIALESRYCSNLSIYIESPQGYSRRDGGKSILRTRGLQHVFHDWRWCSVRFIVHIISVRTQPLPRGYIPDTVQMMQCVSAAYTYVPTHFQTGGACTRSTRTEPARCPLSPYSSILCSTPVQSARPVWIIEELNTSRPTCWYAITYVQHFQGSNPSVGGRAIAGREI